MSYPPSTRGSSLAAGGFVLTTIGGSSARCTRAKTRSSSSLQSMKIVFIATSRPYSNIRPLGEIHPATRDLRQEAQITCRRAAIHLWFLSAEISVVRLAASRRISVKFPKNGWYAACWSKDLTVAPLARTLLGERVVLFRGASGKVGALEDRCCHRAAPLSLGEVVGENLRCGYHGLTFDAEGRCVAVPGQSTVPAGAKVRAYPAVEKWNVVWLWMGDPVRADDSKVVDLPWLADPGWTLTPGYLRIDANAQLLVDNLLDYTHVTYLHGNTIAGDPREATTPTKTERLNDGVRVGRWMIDFKPPPLFAKAGNFAGNVDRWQLATWKPPATVYMDVGCAKTGT